jgi:hypothetical protein
MTIQFQFPPKTREAFTDGDCWVLAWEGANLYALPIVTVSGNESFWIHAANLLPDGRILDIEGIWEQQEWLDRWHATITEQTKLVRELYGESWMRVWDKKKWEAMIHVREMTPQYNEAAYTTDYMDQMMEQVQELTDITI